jgi:mRNA interferase RelE/StbE
MSKLIIPDTVAGLIRNLHPQLKKRVRSSLQHIIDDPESGKRLVDELEGLRSLRVGRFRIVYRIAGRENIEIVAIGPRASIYEETYRLLKKQK